MSNSTTSSNSRITRSTIKIICECRLVDKPYIFRTSSNPKRKFWRCPKWKEDGDYGGFAWDDQLRIQKAAAVVDDFPLGLHDKYLFCISPVDINDDISAQALVQFAGNYAKTGIVRLREIFTPGSLVVPKSQNALKELESIHKVLDLYVWLSFRMEESFPDRELASSQKAACSLLIEEFLERLGWQTPGKASYQRSQLHLQQKYQAILQYPQAHSGS